MRQIKEVIVVEGRYDKNALSQVVKATVIETSGFGIFNDRDKVAMLRVLAKKRGLIILTDSDGAGFVIRNRLRGSIPPELVKHAYIPDVYGKERRKAHGGKEGKLGVEGMPPSVLLEALERAGATFVGEAEEDKEYGGITKADFLRLGLSGSGSAKKRAQLQKKLGLPERMTANALLEFVNITLRLCELEALALDKTSESG